MYRISVLNAATAPAYESLTYSAYRGLLDNTETGVIAVGASHLAAKVGLAVGRVTSQGEGEILSLYITTDHRLRGLGGSLLNLLEAALSKLGCLRLQLTYPAGKSTTEALERLLAKHGWSPGRPRMVLCRVGKGIMISPWIRKGFLPKAYRIFPWAEITHQQAATIRRTQEETRWIPESLLPFQYDRDAEPVNSLALAYRDEVVGWLLTHRIATDTIRYTALYVRKELQRLGRALPLLAEGICRQFEALGPNSFGSFGVPVDNAPMMRFLDQRLAPHLVSRIETRGTFKVLASR